MDKQNIDNFLNERKSYIKLLETDDKIIINGTGSITFFLDKEKNIIKMS